MMDDFEIGKVTIVERIDRPVRVEFDPQLVRLAGDWHGGQDSALYGLASTGALSYNQRYLDTNGKRATDERTADLCYHLYCEVVEHCLPNAAEVGHRDAEALAELADQALTAAAHLWPEEYEEMLNAEPDGYEPSGDSMLWE
jgi:hypothetical protein